MTDESEYADNFERRELRSFERFNQVVTMFKVPMTSDRRVGVEVADGEYVEMFKIPGREDDVVVQIRIDKKGRWVLSRQSFLLDRNSPLIGIDPETDSNSFMRFRLVLQDQIDNTRYLLRTEF